MHIPKKYGQSKVDSCPFCNKQSTTQNSQGVPVCSAHKTAIMNDMKCVCGDYADLMTGKYGFYFRCINCGNLNKNKVLERNEVKDVSKPCNDFLEKKMESYNKENSFKKKKIFNEFRQRTSPDGPTEIEVRSDDPDYFD